MSNYTGTGEFDGDVTVNGHDYAVTFRFYVSGHSDPGRMYMPNGDPGYPPDEGIDDVTIDEVTWTPCEVPDIPEGTQLDSDVDIYEACEAKAWELADDGDFKYDER